MPQVLKRHYGKLKATSLTDLGGGGVADLISEMARRARQILRATKRIELSSDTGKSYFSFRGEEQSRPVNVALYVNNDREFARLLGLFGSGFTGATTDEIVRATYSIAFSVFAAHDVNQIGRKTSATFFEILIGHLVSRTIGVTPRTKVTIPESGAYLPTDFVFDPGKHSRKLHLPIKTSTRERAVQAWVHQLVLERIFGADEYLGVLVVATETKRNSKTGNVIEICVPGQFQMFQSRVTKMSRIYYLDPPAAYLALSSSHPQVDVRPFGEALADIRQLLSAR